MFNEDASPTLVSFLLGGLTGAALAALFLPRSGSDTRRTLHGGIRERTGRLGAWRSVRTSDDRPPAPVSGPGVPEPGLPTTTSGYETGA